MYSYLLSAMLSANVLGIGAAQQATAQETGAPATIHVILPADAKLTIDGMPTKSTSADRWFYTGPLGEGTYVYNFRAEYVKEGKTVTVQEKVTVRAGRETLVTLDFPPPSSSTAFYPPEPSTRSSSRTMPYRRGER
jgi:uncharacterized protein (TIGR03000 family)